MTEDCRKMKKKKKKKENVDASVQLRTLYFTSNETVKQFHSSALTADVAIVGVFSFSTFHLLFSDVVFIP